MQPEPPSGTCDRCTPRGEQTSVRTPHLPRWMVAVALLVGSLLLLSPAGARAQPPNDDRANATIIPSLPFTDAVDTTAATTAPDDPGCYGNGPTVWYEFTPDATGWVSVSAGSSYDTTLSVYVEEAGGLTQLLCLPPWLWSEYGFLFEATAGTTYFLMAGSLESGPGGHLMLTVGESEAPLALDVALSPNSSVAPKTGLVTVRGTVRCNTPAIVWEVSGSLEQRKGRVFIRADFFADVFECTPPETAWSATTANATGLFTGGKARVSFVFATACNSVTCADAFIEGPVTIQLTGNKPRQSSLSAGGG